MRILHADEVLPIFFSRDDFIPENIKKLKITVQVIITKINETPVILKIIFKKAEKVLFWAIIVMFFSGGVIFFPNFPSRGDILKKQEIIRQYLSSV